MDEEVEEYIYYTFVPCLFWGCEWAACKALNSCYCYKHTIENAQWN